MYKNINKGKRSVANLSPLYQIYTPTVILKNINLKVDHHIGGKLFIHSSKHHKENLLLNLEHSCWLCLV